MLNQQKLKDRFLEKRKHKCQGYVRQAVLEGMEVQTIHIIKVKITRQIKIIVPYLIPSMKLIQMEIAM